MTTSVARVTMPVRIEHPIATELRAAAAQFAPFLPAGTDIEYVAAQVFLEFQRVPQLAKCTPASVVSAASRLVSWGFDIGRTGYLVPFADRKAGTVVATPVPGYKGFIELVLATGAARDCDAREVREGDFFEYEYGTEGRLRHRPGFKGGARGRITHFYVVWKIKYGAEKFDVMTLDEVEDIRFKHSKQWKDAWPRGACEAWYGIKTVIRKSSKQLPQNPKLVKFFAALQADEAQELGSPLLSAAKPDDAPDASDRPSTPASAAAPAAAPPAFEEEASVLEVYLPNWKDHPLAGKALGEVSNAELSALATQLRANGGAKYVLLCEAIDSELEHRREEPA